MNLLLFLTVFSSCMIPRFYLLRGTGIYFMHMRVSVYFFMLLILLLTAVMKRKKLQKLALRDIMVFVIWLVVGVIQFGWTKDFGNSMSDVYYLALGALSVLVLNIAIESYEQIRVALSAITVALLFHLALGYYEMQTATHLFSAGTLDTVYPGKPVSIFYNNNDFGSFAIVFLPLALARISLMRVRGNKDYRALFGILVAAASMISVIYAQSDALVFIGVLTVFVSLVIRFSTNRTKAQRAAIILVPIIAMVAIVLLTTHSLDRYVLDFIANEECRMNILRNGFYFMRDKWPFGIGYGNAQYYLKYESIYNVMNVFYFHQWYLEILFCGGVFLFILYCAFHYRLLKRLWKQAAKRLSGLDFFILISFVVFSVICIASSSNLYSEWVWMYLGLLSAYANRCTGSNAMAVRRDAPPARKPAGSPWRSGRTP